MKGISSKDELGFMSPASLGGNDIFHFFRDAPTNYSNYATLKLTMNDTVLDWASSTGSGAFRADDDNAWTIITEIVKP